MAETKTLTFPIDQLTPQGRDLLAFAQRYPAQFGLAAVLIVAGLATIVVPLVLGFTALGPAAGSIAAAWQAAIGNVVAGSFFATMQSMTMTGTFLSVGGGLIGLGVGVGALVLVSGGGEWAKGVERAKGGMSARSRYWVEARRRAEWAIGETFKVAEYAGREAWMRTQEALRDVDLERVVQEALKSVDWERMAQGAQLALAGG